MLTKSTKETLMLYRSIQAHVTLFKEAPVVGETLTLGRKEFTVRRVGKKRYQLIETFFSSLS
jgi:sorbitol-specific phosphotransferase system component IIA